MKTTTKTRPDLFCAVANKTNAHIAAELADEIKDILYKYDGRIPLALAVGVLRIVEKEIIDAA